MLLSGQVAMITGAGRGLGRAISILFAEEGARVAVTGRTKDRRDNVTAEVLAKGGEAHAFALDVAKDEDVEQAVKDILGMWGQIDILVNNAGTVMAGREPAWATTIEEWDEMMRVNMRGVFLCCHAVIPHMMERGEGKIINIGSCSARGAEDGGLGPYHASKWGEAGWTASLAKSIRPHGVRVNGINPGWIDTDMARMLDPNPSPEWSTPEEIAGAALYLATKAPRDMTGQFIDIFGGR